MRTVISSCTSGGKVFVQQAVSDRWHEGWAFVQERVLKCCLPEVESFFELDLRKVLMLKRVTSKECVCPAALNSEFDALHISSKNRQAPPRAHARASAV